jgi:hypothetical protein
MKGLVIAAIALVLPAAVQAESLPVRLKDGATWTITATNVRDGVGSSAQKWTLTTVKALVWSAPKAGLGARLRVSPVSATVGPDSPPEVARARSLAVSATLEVDEALNPGVVVNTEEVRAAFQEVVGRDTRGSEPLADAAVHAMISSELALMARGQGRDLKLGKVLKLKGAIENPLGGGPLSTRDSVSLESFDRASGRAVIVWNQAVDPAALNRRLVSLAVSRAMAANPAFDAKALTTAYGFAFKKAAGVLKNSCRHEVDISTGLAVSAQCRTTSRMTYEGETSETTDTWTITQTLPEPR